ncbi:MAG: rod shape-determining protein [Pseudomonadales bacterium]|nr:rod shape-determining protein [Pseudomonadales bacterium]
MDRIEAKILIKNLLSRIKPIDADQYELSGVLTDGELQALHFALDTLEGRDTDVPMPTPAVSAVPAGAAPPALPAAATDDFVGASEDETFGLELNLSVFDLPEPSSKERLCLDFGTAMSKASLVINDPEDDEFEEIHVLELGIPGDQQEVSDTMLISSLYIDNHGLLWFGKNAVDRSLVEGKDGQRMRVDNVKRYLSEDAMQMAATAIYNPTAIPLTGGDLLLAYLMFMTWAANSCTSKLGIPKNVKRRFAMPCFSAEQSRTVEGQLRTLLGEAQVLADTFSHAMQKGIPVAEFSLTMKGLRETPKQYDFVTDALTEPLGVANALLSSDSDTRRLTLIVDVGAGTSDVSLYRLHVDSTTGTRQALEAKGAARGITLAGNHLDRALLELILKKGNIGPDNPRSVNIRSALTLNIRDNKEALFTSGTLAVRLLDGQGVEVELAELYDLAAVQSFRSELKNCLTETLEQVDDSWVGLASNDGLAVILTGGGSKLEMVRELASGEIEVKGKTIRLLPTAAFPDWLREEYPALEDDFPRIAVSLGGGRESLIRHRVAQVTAGDVRSTPILGRF